MVKRKIGKYAWKHKKKVGLVLTHIGVGAYGAYRGGKTALGLANYSAYERKQLRQIKRNQKGVV